MTTSPPREHPYWHARAVIKNHLNSIKAIEMSFYEYTPQSLADSRMTFSISAQDFLNESYISETINRCPPKHELAIHSKLITNSNIAKHIPMIDMSTGSAAQLSKLRPILDQDFEKFSWYKSGRSYHGYGTELISNEEWIVLMGKLLLANQIGFPPTVDPRWVGHRLVAGYAALRWTKNTTHYIDTPRSLAMFERRS